jgi:hypothetical protein
MNSSRFGCRSACALFALLAGVSLLALPTRSVLAGSPNADLTTDVVTRLTEDEALGESQRIEDAGAHHRGIAASIEAGRGHGALEAAPRRRFRQGPRTSRRLSGRPGPEFHARYRHRQQLEQPIFGIKQPANPALHHQRQNHCTEQRLVCQGAATAW